VARSTPEAEYLAGGAVAQHLAVVRNFLEELGAPLKGAVPVFCDNEAAVKWCEKPEQMPAKARHIRVEYHYFRQEAQADRIAVKAVRSPDNAADGFTKPLPPEGFERFIRMIKMMPMNAAEGPAL